MSKQKQDREIIAEEVKKLTSRLNNEFLEEVGTVLKRDFGCPDEASEKKAAIDFFLQEQGAKQRERLRNSIVQLVENMISSKICSEIYGRDYISEINTLMNFSPEPASYMPLYNSNRENHKQRSRDSLCSRVRGFFCGR